MKNITLTHNYTPAELDTINQKLFELLVSEDPNEESFYALSVQRDECISTYLSTLDGDDKTSFCKAEIQVNNALVAHAEQLFNASLLDLTNLVRGRKAVKKYT